MREHVVRAAVREFNRVKDELGELVDVLPPGSLVALVRQHHHSTDADQGWAFSSLSFEMGTAIDSTYPGILIGGLVESRPSSEGQAMKHVKIYLDPESIDSIEIETFDQD